MVKKYTSFFYKVFYVVYIIIAIQCLAGGVKLFL